MEIKERFSVGKKIKTALQNDFGLFKSKSDTEKITPYVVAMYLLK